MIPELILSLFLLFSSSIPFKEWDFQRSSIPQKEVTTRRINIDVSAQEHQLPSRLKRILDSLITAQIHEQVASGNFEKSFYEERGFKVLKAGSTLVIEHPQFPGYLIKASSGVRQFYYGIHRDAIEEVNVAQSNLLRPAGHDYYAQHGSDDLFSFPEEYLYESPHGKGRDRFYAISQKLEVYTKKESLDIIRSLNRENQLRIAKKMSDLIQQAQVTDMHPDNLLLRRDLSNWTFAIIDQEPVGLFIEENDNPASLVKKEELVLAGLVIFRDLYCRENGLLEMANYIEKRIKLYLKAHPEIDVIDHGRLDSC